MKSGAGGSGAGLRRRAKPALDPVVSPGPIAVLLLSLLAAGPGCLVYKAATAPVKLAATTVVTASETAGAVVVGTGKLAVSAVQAAGSLGSTGIESAAKLGQAGMVTFVDPARGTMTRVPWAPGLTLAGAGTAAKIDLARRAVDVVRAGRVVLSASGGAPGAVPVNSGDVVRVGG